MAIARSSARDRALVYIFSHSTRICDLPQVQRWIAIDDTTGSDALEVSDLDPL
ncbi:hypothetical protein [Chroococcidiopsis sp. SAG 2025]|uniref:hypothetical protein n=1 Tax=Chroococcidiopsis sp. SAG 2025 TaxID=171389 RepID=UPI002936FFEF|nr:hypothetical protein [Chroococcidiopsis sp. SAG 2025]